MNQNKTPRLTIKLPNPIPSDFDSESQPYLENGSTTAPIFLGTIDNHEDHLPSIPRRFSFGNATRGYNVGMDNFSHF